MEKLEIINHVTFFKELSAAEKEAIAQLDLRIFKYEAKGVIIRAQSEETHLYVLIKGTATVLDAGSNPLAILKPGEAFGEISFLGKNQPRTATVVANTEVIVMRLARDSFAHLAAEVREKIKDKLIDVVIKRLTGQLKKDALDLSCEWITIRP